MLYVIVASNTRSIGGEAMPVVRISDELFKEVQKYAEPLVDDFESALWKALGSNKKSKKPTPPETGELTRQGEFWRPILEALVEMGAQGSRQEVHKAVERKMKGRLKPGDYQLNRDGTTKWGKAVDYQRLKMKHEGLIAGNTPRGIWKITDQGRRWLSQQ